MSRKIVVKIAAVLAVLVVSSSAFAQAIPQKNVNVIGPTPVNWLYAGNPRMQQNEPECAVSPNNTNWLFCGFNDYRGVNDSNIGDSNPGVAMSRDRGKTWISGLAPGHLASPFSIGQKFGADANIEALPGLLIYNYIAGWRDDTRPGGVYVGRYYEHNREVGPPWEFLNIVEVDVGTSGKFLDKPAFDVSLRDPALGLSPITVDIPEYIDPRNPANVVEAYTLEVPAARTHLCYSVFVGNDNNDGTKLTCVASDDGGATWPIKNKISESSEINQGSSVATRNFGEEVLVTWRRFDDNNETSAIMYAYSGDAGNTFTKPKVVTEFCAFDQGTGAARFRTNALPVAVNNGGEFAIYFASRNDATKTCFEPNKGKNKTLIPRMSDVAMIDDFDRFGETNGEKDGKVRTFLNFSRIMMVRGSGSGNNMGWSIPAAIDPQEYPAGAVSEEVPIPAGARKRGHQFMPAAESAGGVETVAWYDSRLDKLNTRNGIPLPGGFVEDLVVHFEKSSSYPESPKWDNIQLLPAGIYGIVPPPPNLPPAVDNIPLRRNIDVFAAQIAAGGVPKSYQLDENFYPSSDGVPGFPSTRVSRFKSKPVQKLDSAGSPVLNEFGDPVIISKQLEYNYPNGRLFRKGKAPFIGDYNSVFAPQYRKRQDGTWVPNQSVPQPGTDLFASPEPIFHVGWTSNRHVRGRVYYTGCDTWNESLQMWESSDDCPSDYTDPQPGMLLPLQGADGSQDGPVLSCSAAGLTAPLTRNQNIFTAALLPDVTARVISAIKPPVGNVNTFVIAFDNGTDRDRRLVLTLPTGTNTSFIKDADPALRDLSIDVVVPRGSSNSRTVFDYANELDTSVQDIVVLTARACAEDASGNPVLNADGDCDSLGGVVAQVALERSSLAPLETVQNNPRCLTFDAAGNCTEFDSLIDVNESEVYDLILTREDQQDLTKQLDLQNLDLQNLDLQNTVQMLDLQNLDLQNQDLENLVLFLDLQNLDLQNLDLQNALYENLDLQNLDLQNRSLYYLDTEDFELENTFLQFLDLQNLDLQNLDLQNLDLQNLDLQNLDLQNLDLQNLDLQNLDLQNSTFFAADLENLDLQNLDLQNTAEADTYTEVTWTVDSATNTTTGVDVKPIFSPAIQQAVAENSDFKVLLTVRQPYMTGTVVTNEASFQFCAPQVVVDNQLLYAKVLDAGQINADTSDPDANVAGTASFATNPDQSTIIALRYINPPPGLDLQSNSGMAVYSQPGDNASCDPELDQTNVDLFDCEIDYIAPDVVPPVVTLVGSNPDTVEAGSGEYFDPGATATDEVDGSLTPVITSNTVNTTIPDTYSVTWSATDAASNTGSATRTVEVVDTTAPTITLAGDNPQTIEAGDAYVELGATASDIVDGDNLIVTEIYAGAVNTALPGTYVVSYDFSDEAGNAATQVTRTVEVVDTTAPIVALLGDNPLELQATADAYVDAGATAVDAVYGMLLPVITANDVDPTMVGAYSVTYTATDGSSNSASVTRTVNVVDTTDPVIIITDPPDFTPDEPFVLPPGATTLPISWPVSAQDLEAGLSLVCTIDGEDVDPTSTSYTDGVLTAVFDYDFAAGTTSVTCTVTDQGGNSATSDPFDVLVEDIPVITALEGTIVIPTDGGATASVSNSQLAANISVVDQIDPDLSDAIVCLADDPTDFTIGEHTIECSVTDSGGYEASTTFQLEVVYPYDVVILPLKGNIKAGSTVPLDWYYVETGTSNRVNSSAVDPMVAWFGAFSDRNCSTGSDGTGDGAEDSGSSSIRYSLSDDTWRLNWQTPSTEGYVKVIVTPPGTDASAECVRLRK
ncbi:MAG: immunoglobulin-like domain-containing protein [Woeseiaceae bacterium]